MFLKFIYFFFFEFNIYIKFLFYAVSKWCVCLFVVIGRGGEQINKIQQESGCKVQIAPGESNTGSEESSGHICSNSVHFFPRFVFPDICCLNVRDVTEFVGVVSFRQRWSSREERVSHRRPWSHPVRLGLFTFFICSVSLYVVDLLICLCRKAKMLLDDIVSRGRGTPPSFHESTNGSGNMQEMIIPAGKAGLIIGKGGETIKQLQVEFVLVCLYREALI